MENTNKFKKQLINELKQYLEIAKQKNDLLWKFHELPKNCRNCKYSKNYFTICQNSYFCKAQVNLHQNLKSIKNNSKNELSSKEKKDYLKKSILRDLL